MFQNNITNFLQYCKNPNFAKHSFASQLTNEEVEVLEIQNLL